MIYWIDAQLPPAIATWLVEKFGVNAIALRDVGLRDAEDTEIFNAAKLANAIVITKDSDFIELVMRLGAPPQILWITCGNVTNLQLQKVLSSTFENANQMLKNGESIVEIG